MAKKPADQATHSSSKKAALSDVEVALHHHKKPAEKITHDRRHPYRPAGFALMVAGIILLCFSCIWWAVSGKIVITTKENLNALRSTAQYQNATQACKYLRPTLVDTYLGPDAYLFNPLRWQPVDGPLRNGQLYYETCSYRIDKPDLHASLEIYGYTNSDHAAAVWNVIKSKAVKPVALPVDSMGRESFNEGTNARYVLYKSQIYKLTYGPVLRSSVQFLTPQMVNDYMTEALKNMDYFIQKGMPY